MKALYVIGVLVLFIGLFFAFLPHAVHEGIGLKEHDVHTLYGSVLTVLGGAVLVADKRLNTAKRQKNLRSV